jgi:hypothetical protein
MGHFGNTLAIAFKDIDEKGTKVKDNRKFMLEMGWITD